MEKINEKQCIRYLKNAGLLDIDIISMAKLQHGALVNLKSSEKPVRKNSRLYKLLEFIVFLKRVGFKDVRVAMHHSFYKRMTLNHSFLLIQYIYFRKRRKIMIQIIRSR
jgi:hypothetical protein